MVRNVILIAGVSLLFSACGEKTSVDDTAEKSVVETPVPMAEEESSGWPYLDGRTVNNFWPGEYPMGLVAVNADVVLKGYNKMDPGSAQTLDCPMEQGGFYHPWNAKRVKANSLEFFSVVKRQELILKQDVSTEVYIDGKAQKRTFKAGEPVVYLGPMAEGYGFIEVDGKKAEVSLEAILSQTDYIFNPDANIEDLWMKMDCSGQAGFILTDTLNPEFVKKGMDGVIGYGESGDLDETQLAQLQRGSDEGQYEYVCYTRDDNKSKRIWIRLGHQGKADAIKYEGSAEAMMLSFVSDEMNDEGANPTTRAVYNEMYDGGINGAYTLTHSGIWDYVNYVRGSDGKVFNFTIDHNENPYGQ